MSRKSRQPQSFPHRLARALSRLEQRLRPWRPLLWLIAYLAAKVLFRVEIPDLPQ